MKLLYRTLFIALVALMCNKGFAQVPEKPANASPVVDLAGIINNDSLVNAMNAELDSLSKQTQNQIVVVTVNDMGEMDPKVFATEIGKKWGVGGKKLNNGLVMAIKPKNDNGDGLIGFATGYGMEGAFPDVFCKHLQNDYMVPHFIDGDYAGGIKAAIDEIVPIVLDDYSKNQAQALASDNGKKKGNGSGWFILATILVAIGLIMVMRRRGKAAQAATQPQSSPLANNDDGKTEESEETEKTDEPEKDDTYSQDEPKPYKYEYGGGEFGGGGASTKF